MDVLRLEKENPSSAVHMPSVIQNGGGIGEPVALARSHTATTLPLAPPHRDSEPSPVHVRVHALAGSAVPPTSPSVSPQ